jgi:dienelactone hydrolase
MLHRSVRPLVLLALASACGFGACGTDDKGTAATVPVSARFTVPPDGTLPQLLDVPFPSDVYLSNGKYTDAIPGFDKLVKQSAKYLSHELAKQNGYSRISLASFYIDDNTLAPDDNGDPISASIDPQTLPKTEADCIADESAVFLIDLSAADPASARVPCRAAFHGKTGLSKLHPSLGVGPARGKVLPAGKQFAAVLTSRVKDKTGRSVGRAPAFDSAVTGKMAGTPLGDLYSAAFSKVTAALGSALAADGAQIVAIAPYTTQKAEEELYALRDSLEASPKPTLGWDDAAMAPLRAARFAQKVGGTLPTGFAASLDEWLGAASAKLPDGSDDPNTQLPVRAHDKIAAVGSAAFTAQSFLVSKPGGYDDLDHATFASPPVAVPQKIWISFAIPTGAMPAAGYPAILYQHGLSGSRADFLDIANTFTKAGFIVAAIDSITFGARAPETHYQTDLTTNFPKAPGATFTGPDGFADPYLGETNGPFDLFGGLKNMGSLRDQMRQAELDTAQVVRVLRSSPDLSALATNGVTPKIDPANIGYVGDSLGGIQGGVAAAIEPGVRAWVLNVAGGGIMPEVAAHGPIINIQLAAAGAINFGFTGDRFDESHPFVGIAQTIVEAGDPIIYASHLVTNPAKLAGAPTKPRNVLQIEVLYDELVSNESNEALARAAGFALAKPNVGSNAGVFDIKNLDANPQRIAFAEVSADASGIHDTPVAGVTAVLAQVSPGGHGYNLVSGEATRRYAIPFNSGDPTAPPFRDLSQYQVKTSYRELQATINGFFGSAFKGGVPVVSGLPAPIRDVDGDGTPDATDPKPDDASVK